MTPADKLRQLGQLHVYERRRIIEDCLPELATLVEATSRVPGLHEPWSVRLKDAYAALAEKVGADQ
jgi:hypothetical protein